MLHWGKVCRADFRCNDLHFTTNKWRERDSRRRRGFRQKLHLWANGVHSGAWAFIKDSRPIGVLDLTVWRTLAHKRATLTHSGKWIFFLETTKCLPMLWCQLLSLVVVPLSACKSTALLLQIQMKLFTNFGVPATLLNHADGLKCCQSQENT